MRIAGIILGAVLLLLLLLLSLRLRVSAEFGADGFTAHGRAGPLRFALYPPEPKKKPKREKKKKPPEPEPDTKPGGSLQLLTDLLPALAKIPARLRRHLCIDRLNLDLIWGGTDPADAAIGYGMANAAIGTLWPFFEGFRIRKHRIRTALDFDAHAPTVYLHAEVSITVGGAIGLGLPLLSAFIRSKNRQKDAQKEAART